MLKDSSDINATGAVSKTTADARVQNLHMTPDYQTFARSELVAAVKEAVNPRV